MDHRDHEVAAPVDLFNIRIDSKHAHEYATERPSGEKPSPATTDKVRAAKYASVGSGSPRNDWAADRGADNLEDAAGSKRAIRYVREKARLLEEVRQNKERAIEHAQAQVEAQQRRKRRAEAGALNFSMRFEGNKDMAKFERHVQDVFSKKKAKKANRNALSIDFGGLSTELNFDVPRRREPQGQTKMDQEGSGTRAKVNRSS